MFSPDTWISIAALVISVGSPLMIYLLRSSGKQQAEEAVEPLYTSRNAHEIRIVRLEEQMKYLPQQRDFQKLNDNVAAMAGDMKSIKAEVHALSESQKRTETAVSVITETMMTKGQS